MASGARKALSLMFGIGGKLDPSLSKATGEAGKQLDVIGEKAKKVSEATKMRDLKTAYSGLGKAGADVSKAWGGLTSEIMRTGKQAALAIGGITAASYGLATATGMAGDKAYKSAQKIGMSTQAFSELAWAAKQSGAEQEAFTSSLAKFNKTLMLVKTGKGPVDLFKRMNVSIKDAKGNLRGTEDVLMDVFKVFDKNKNLDSKVKQRMLEDMFGKSGLELLPFFDQGAAGLEKLMLEARRLGITFDDEAGEAAVNFMDSMGEIKASAQALVYTLGKQLMPHLTEINRALVAWWEANRELVSQKFGEFVKAAAAYLPTLRKYIKDAASWIKVTAIRVDEVAQRFGGWESVIQKLIMAWASWRALMIATQFAALLGTIGGLIGAFGKFATAVQAVGFGKAIMNVGTLGKALTGLQAGFMGIIGAVKALGVAMLANPMLLVLAALVAAIYLIWRDWDAWCKFWGDTMDVILDKWDALCGWVGEKWDQATAYLTELLSPLGDAWEGFVQMNKDLWGAWTEWFGAKCDAIFDWWDSVCESLSAKWDAICDSISSVFSGTIDSVMNLPIVQRAIEFGSNFIKGFIEAITGAATAVKNAVLDLLPSLSEVMAKAAELGGAIKDGIMAPIKGLGNIGRGAADAIFDSFGGRAAGGLITKPELSWLGEKGPEMVIPLDRSQRALSLLSETANRLGVVAPRSEELVNPRPSSLEKLGSAVASTTNIDNRRGGAMTINFNQKADINISGDTENADKTRQAVSDAFADMRGKIKDVIEDYFYEQARVAMR